MTDAHYYDKLTAINNELVNIQRELARKNLVLQQARDDLEFINRITLTASQGRDLDEVLCYLAEAISQHLDVGGTEVYIFDDDRKNFTCVVDYDSPGGYHYEGEIIGSTWSMEILRKECQQRLLAGEILIIDWAENAECMTEDLRRSWRYFGTQAGAAVPISRFGQVIGFLHVWSQDKDKRFSDSEQQLLTIVSQHVAGVLGMSATLEREREARQRAEAAERAYQKANRELELLNSIASEMTAETDLKDSLLAMAIRLAHHLCVFRIRIKMFDVSAQRWHIEVEYTVPTGIDSSTVPGGSIEVPLLVNKQIHERILKGESVLTENIAHDPQESQYYRLTCMHDGVHTCLAVPLFGYHEVKGMMSLYLSEEGRHFSSDEIRLAENVARQSTGLIEVMQALEAEKHALSQAESIMKVSEAFTQSLKIDIVVKTVLSELCQALELDSAYVFLIEDDMLMLAGSTDETDGNFLPLPLKVNSIPHNFLSTAHITNIVEKHQAGDTSLATLSIPLIVADESIGLLVIRGRSGYLYSNLEKTLIRGIANAAAIAINNARLHERAHQQATMAERQRLARNLHDSVTQSLYGLTLLASGWANMADQGRLDDPGSNIRELGMLGQQGLKEMRLLIHQLREPQLEKMGLIEALQQRLDAVEKRADVDVEFTADADLVNLPLALQEHIYYIVQEALNNSLRHAKATMIRVHIGIQKDRTVIVVEDDGNGFDTTLHTVGMGLENMRTRAKMIGAELAIESRPEKGTTITVEIQPQN